MSQSSMASIGSSAATLNSTTNTNSPQSLILGSTSMTMAVPSGHGHHHHHHHHHHHSVVPNAAGNSTMSNRQVYILKGEISVLISSLKRTSQQRWSSHQQVVFDEFKNIHLISEVIRRLNV